MNSHISEERMYHLIAGSPIGFLSYILSRNVPRIILAYHGICANHQLCVPYGMFKQQIRYIKEKYDIVSVNDIVNQDIEQKSPLIAITFDDAYKNINEDALPFLCSQGIPATIYAPVDYIGRRNEWDATLSYNPLPIMEKDDLKNIIKQGFHVGSHTRSHKRLKRMNHETLRSEIIDSKHMLEDIIGKPVSSFSYPHGGRNDFDRKAVEIVRQAGYLTGVSTFWGRHNEPGNRYTLRRIIIWPTDSFERFQKKLAGYYDWLALKENIVNTMRSIRLGCSII